MGIQVKDSNRQILARMFNKIQLTGKNNHTANKNKQSKYGKLYFIEHSSEYLSQGGYSGFQVTGMIEGFFWV